MTKPEVRQRIEEIGIIPAVRVSSADDASFVAEAVSRAGIPIAEITMTVPGAIEVIYHLARSLPNMVVGANSFGSGNGKAVSGCWCQIPHDPGLVVEVVEIALQNDVVVFPGALTPTEVIAAWKAGADFIKVFPCAPVGGHHYIRSLKTPFPQVRLIAAGGVNQLTAADFILAGATALGIGHELIPQDAIQRRREDQIAELARRFLIMVKTARRDGAFRQ